MEDLHKEMPKECASAHVLAHSQELLVPNQFRFAVEPAVQMEAYVRMVAQPGLAQHQVYAIANARLTLMVHLNLAANTVKLLTVAQDHSMVLTISLA
jgi:hypothetical protein